MSFLTACSASIHRGFENSVFARPFHTSDTVDRAGRQGFFARILAALRISVVFAAFKKSFATAAETSVFGSFWRHLVNSFLSVSVQSVGVFSLSFGVYSAAAYAVSAYAFGDKSFAYETVICSAACIICGILFVFSKKSLSRKLSESRVFGFLLFDLLGINPLTLKPRFNVQNHNAAAILLGMILGVCSFFASPYIILLYTAIAIFCVVAFHSPESGLLSLIFCLPLANMDFIYFVIAVTLFSYLIKLLRGKRNIAFCAADVFVYLFFAAYSIATDYADIGVVLLSTAVYFLITNLIRNKNLADKSVSMLSAGLFINLLFISLMSVLGFFGSPGVLPFSISIISEDFLVLVSLPVSFALRSRAGNASAKLFALLFVILSLFCTVISFSRAVWLGAAVVIFVYFWIKTSKLLNVIAASAFIVPLFMLFADCLEIYNRVFPLSLAEFSWSDAAPAFLLGGANADADSGFFGALLLGGGIFTLLLFAFAGFMVCQRGTTAVYQNGEPAVRRFFAALFAAETGFVCVGLLPGSWNNPRIFVLLWIICGLLSCMGNVFRKAYVFDDGEVRL